MPIGLYLNSSKPLDFVTAHPRTTRRYKATVLYLVRPHSEGRLLRPALMGVC